MSKELNIVHLYPETMNIYGDTGNIVTLEKRLNWRTVKSKVSYIDVGDKGRELRNADIIFAGGGQDSTQKEVSIDLQSRKDTIEDLVRGGVVILTICGTYQLFGHKFATLNGEILEGIGIFNAETKGGEERLIGNAVIESPFGDLVGFENHGGRTYLLEGQEPLGRMKKGYGNNDETDDGGAIVNNTFGTYLHGPLLPKNPHFTDTLIFRAIKNKYGATSAKSIVKPLNNGLENRAAEIAKERP